MLERDLVRVSIEGLSVRTYLGIHAHEQEAPREVCVDVQFDYERPLADSMEAGIDYRWVRDQVLSVAENRRFGLIEVLSETILNALTAESRMKWASVRVHKAGALRQARAVTAVVEWRST
ncbi:MAG TPA: dihydroneopterin aldolase [Acidobacteriaceae bacterium]|jgi:dihydroneopterin aldolase